MISHDCPIKLFSNESPHHLALLGPGVALTYRALDRQIDAMHLPFKPGEIVPFFPQSRVEDILFFFACYRRKAVPFPLSHRSPLARTRERVSKIQGVKEPEAATLILTSGSTAQPKIVRLSMDNHLLSAQGAIEFLKIDPTDRLLLSLPLFHVGGLSLLFRAFCSGSTLILPSTYWLDSLEAHRPTRFSLVPYQLKKLLKERLKLPFCRSLLLGGQALPEELCAEAERHGFPVVTTFGLSEMASMVTANYFKEGSSLGLPLHHRELKIAEDGEILVRGGVRFLGYMGQRELPPDEWFPTKDIGSLGKGLTVCGRKDRQFISGGENIHPEEIERALLVIEWIEEVKVIPKADPEFGERPHALIRPFAKVDEIASLLTSRLPKFMIPTSFEALQEATKLSGDR